MKKFFRTVTILAAIMLSVFSVSSCFVDTNIDSWVLWSSSSSYSSINNEDDGGIKASDIDDVIKGIFSAEGETFSNSVLLRSQHSESQVKKRASAIADKVENAIRAKYPNVEQQLSAQYKSLSYSISYSFNGKDVEVWSMTIR